MRTVLSVLIAAIVVVALASCGGEEPAAPTGYAPDQTSEAYAYVHGGYVGKAVVETDGEGELSATLDEAFLPHTLAVVDLESDEWNEDNTVYYMQRGNEVRVAKYVSYDGTDYVGSTVGEALVYVEADEDGEPAGNVGLEKSILRNQRTMASYFNGIQDGAFAVYTEFGGEPETVTTTSYGGLTKADSNYWDAEPGWKGNMEAIQEAVAEHGTGYKFNELNQNDEGTWQLADAVTGATLSDFPDYFNLIQNAAGRLDLE
ncbi:MAG: hypothetical protein ACLFM6_06320 [Spirochaetaceae bacterium]